MNANRDIVAASIHFLSGVAIAASLPLSGAEWLWSASAGCAGLFLTALPLLSYKIESAMIKALLIRALFFCTGMVSWFPSALYGDMGWVDFGFAEQYAGKLYDLIDSMSFDHPSTKNLLKALLLGQSKALSPEIKTLFRKSGASHILALSGLHLGIIYGIIRKILTPFGNTQAAVVARSMITIAACCFYALMTGASPSIVRALIFIILEELFRLSSGRAKRPIRIYCTALMIQVAIAPQSIKTLGFQLSYLAMLGIIVIAPAIEKWYPEAASFKSPMRKLWSTLSVSISCQATTAPLVWKVFHSLPQYFMITNLVALPLCEGMIVCAVAAISLEAIAKSPEILLRATDYLAEAMLFCLNVIAGL